MNYQSQLKSVPWWGIPLIALASFRIESHGEGYSFRYDGSAVAVIALAIIAAVLLFKILSGFQDYLLAAQRIRSKVHSPYWPLLAFVIIFPMIGYRATSDEVLKRPGIDEPVFRWDFEWGHLDWHLWFIGGFFLFLFLHTTLLLVREASETIRESEQTGDANAVKPPGLERES